ncbi:MAG: YqjF family protein [Akkermansiaceae bacterium]
MFPELPSAAARLAAREQPDSPVVMKQDWSHLLFLHWEFSIDEIQARLPEGIYVDTFEGKAYLGIVPFFMEKIRPSYCPSVPGISYFQELNLRTYVYDQHGRPGVWFFTLDCNQWLAVKIARQLFHLPYNHAQMTSSENEGLLTYSSRRKNDEATQTFVYPFDLKDRQTAVPESLEFFLLERYRLFSQRNNGSIYQGLVHHRPYQYQSIDTSEFPTRLFSLCGFKEPDTPCVSAIIADTVSVKIHPLSQVL